MTRSREAQSTDFFASLADQPEWMRYGPCASTDPEAFFPEKGESTRAAKAVCARCDFRDQCLQFALDNGERFGVWGGLSERERRDLRRELPEAS
ncbi:WhiB family transcriptional regulator [Gordonia sp. DT218]|uniref:WhiB family transcriptional regulator n=1 Tax=Gordonia sp. DT218 TaxID=3416659 RepID=UPI003CF1EF28